MVVHDRRILGALVAIAALAVLTGCADTPATAVGATEAEAVPGLTLAQSKSYAQLLRNEASARLPPIVLKEVAVSSDDSFACGSSETDPDGLVRAWQSSTEILITNSTAPRIQTTTDDLVATFTEQGWIAEATTTGTTTVTDLASDASLASIEIVTAQKAEGQVPLIRITATGACALTGGAESDEVEKLAEPQTTSG